MSNNHQVDLSQICVIVLAAGKGTRMKSEESKVFFPFFGKPLLWHILHTLKMVKTKKIVSVIAPADQKRAETLFDSMTDIVIQQEALGTGDAVKKAWEYVPEEKYYLILCGDTPLIQPETLQSLAIAFCHNDADVAFITAVLEDPKKYGRIIRDASGEFCKIVEHKEATVDQKLICEVNSGIYLFKNSALRTTLHLLQSQNSARELYLTDALELIKQQGGRVSIVQVKGEKEILGINTRKDLSKALSEVYLDKIDQLMIADGVSIIAPQNTFIDPRVTIGKDSIIKPFCYLEGPVHIGEKVSIGPFVCIRASEESPVFIESNCQVGPFSSLRGGSHLKEHVHVGTYVEIKKSTLDEGSKAMHLSYLGDAEIGKKVNIGAGTITCNYDGQYKHKTIIKDGAFIGSDAILVAPLSIGEMSYIAAGSTITEDVPDQSLGIGRSKQVNKTGWRKRSILPKKTEGGEGKNNE